MTPTIPRYTRPAIALHWLMALGLLATIAVGWWAAGLPMSPQRLKALNNHKWLGVTLLGLALVRGIWRLRHAPPPPTPMPDHQRLMAQWVHGALYALMLLVPLLGWAYSNAAGFPVVWLGILPLPDLVPKDPAWAELFKGLHKIAAWGLVALIAAHIAAAVKHHFIDRDGLLNRMRWH
ncbi:cytochrome b [Inhella gelatinilytica]|uniref:Cytochrome b n=1 Tax=Inhella gelatinilytica TaxID=2795030 RepID=A0A931NBH6_9BURK|nr:cytochrome b [Inhella gelatinilytica]MBH9553593.1 cytochrome b [Inhella gelatinilytica]